MGQDGLVGGAGETGRWGGGLVGGVGWTGGWRAGWQVGSLVPVPIFLNFIANLQTYKLGMHIWNQYET